MTTTACLRLALVPMLAIAGLLLGGGRPAPAAAHPSGTVTVDRYAGIELYAHTVRLQYVADYSEIPSLRWWVTHDTDGDGAISAAELDAYVETAKHEILAGFDITLGGERIWLDLLGHRSRFSLSDLGAETLRVELWFEGAVAGASPAEFEFLDLNFAQVPGWRTITIRPSPQTVSTVPSDLLEDRSQALTVYPPE